MEPRLKIFKTFSGENILKSLKHFILTWKHAITDCLLLNASLFLDCEGPLSCADEV